MKRPDGAGPTIKLRPQTLPKDSEGGYLHDCVKGDSFRIPLHVVSGGSPGTVPAPPQDPLPARTQPP